MREEIRMGKIENIIIHCSDSLWGCAREVRKWHLQKGWSDIGYQFVILNGRPTPENYVPSLDGSIECGRYLDENLILVGDEVGAHALGYNDRSIGICLIGINGFTDRGNKQLPALSRLILDLIVIYKVPVEKVLGHYETESGKVQGKTCPNFDVAGFREILKFETRRFKGAVREREAL